MENFKEPKLNELNLTIWNYFKMNKLKQITKTSKNTKQKFLEVNGASQQSNFLLLNDYTTSSNNNYVFLKANSSTTEEKSKTKNLKHVKARKKHKKTVLPPIILNHQIDSARDLINYDEQLVNKQNEFNDASISNFLKNNESLRWQNALEDYDQEINRINQYKSNRRKRYIEQRNKILLSSRNRMSLSRFQLNHDDNDDVVIGTND